MQRKQQQVGWSAGMTAIRMGDLDTMTVVSDPQPAFNSHYVQVSQGGFIFAVDIEDLYETDELEAVLGDPPGSGHCRQRIRLVASVVVAMVTGLVIGLLF